MARPKSWENIGPDMTPEAHKNIKRGQLLVFQLEDEKTKFKVMSMTDGIWVKKIFTYTQDEMARMPYLQDKVRGKKVIATRKPNDQPLDEEL